MANHDQVVRATAALMNLVTGMQQVLTYPGAECTATPCAVVYPGRVMIDHFSSSGEGYQYDLPVRILFERQPAATDAIQRATLFAQQVEAAMRSNVNAAPGDAAFYLTEYDIKNVLYEGKWFVGIAANVRADTFEDVTSRAGSPLVS